MTNLVPAGIPLTCAYLKHEGRIRSSAAALSATLDSRANSVSNTSMSLPCGSYTVSLTMPFEKVVELDRTERRAFWKIALEELFKT